MGLDLVDLAEIVQHTNSKFVAGFFANGNGVERDPLCLYCEEEEEE